MNGFRDTATDELTAKLAEAGVTYDPETGIGYDIEGAPVWKNGTWNPNAQYEPVTVYKIPPAPKPDTSQYLLWGLVGFGLIYLLSSKGKRR